MNPIDTLDHWREVLKLVMKSYIEGKSTQNPQNPQSDCVSENLPILALLKIRENKPHILPVVPPAHSDVSTWASGLRRLQKEYSADGLLLVHEGWATPIEKKDIEAYNRERAKTDSPRNVSVGGEAVEIVLGELRFKDYVFMATAPISDVKGIVFAVDGILNDGDEYVSPLGDVP